MQFRCARCQLEADSLHLLVLDCYAAERWVDIGFDDGYGFEYSSFLGGLQYLGLDSVTGWYGSH